MEEKEKKLTRTRAFLPCSFYKPKSCDTYLPGSEWYKNRELELKASRVQAAMNTAKQVCSVLWSSSSEQPAPPHQAPLAADA